MSSVFIVTGQTEDIEDILGVFSTVDKAESFIELAPDDIYDNMGILDIELDGTGAIEAMRQLDTEGNSGRTAHNVVELFPNLVPPLKIS